jgi:hypothetical protein
MFGKVGVSVTPGVIEQVRTPHSPSNRRRRAADSERGQIVRRGAIREQAPEGCFVAGSRTGMHDDHQMKKKKWLLPVIRITNGTSNTSCSHLLAMNGLKFRV